MNLAQHLEMSAYFFPDRPAVSSADGEMTYGMLEAKASRIATALISMGIKPGDHIGLWAPNSADWIAFYFGVLKAGAVAVTLSWALSARELALLLGHSRPKIIFTDSSKLEAVQSARESAGVEKIICKDGDLDLSGLLAAGSEKFRAIDRERLDTAAVLYTGGTTGMPKGVMLTHQGIAFSSWSIAYCERSTEKDRALCFLPFNHVFGQIHIMNATILAGGCLELLPTFDLDRVLHLMETGRITKFFAVPTIYVRLLGVDDLEKRKGALRYSFSAAASMPMNVVKQWKERTGITIAESLGMTEVMPLSYNHFYSHKVGSVGQILPQVEVQIRDLDGNRLPDGERGEICARGPNVMKGYLNNPEATAAAFWEGGWLRTEDIGLFDEDRYLFIVDRLKDLIITGGENVYPREVEELLYTRAEVEECALIGLPDENWGERVTAIIKVRAGQSLEPDKMSGFLKSSLAPFKVPKEYIVVDELPKSPTGKILKRELRTQFRKGNV
ncbi:MAG: AMP-binding protein [Deltaproteobacteria bacterium]|jgi:long-chain acyl-CoA synthetase|nr:AMP-binding protein [Deltaproteobacteria bacterium]